MATITSTVTLKGPFFTKKIDELVKRMLVGEVLNKVEERTERQGKGLGAQKNRIDHRRDGLELTIDSTLVYPRTRGTSWLKKNTSIVKAMAPRVMRKAAQRITEELG